MTGPTSVLSGNAVDLVKHGCIFKKLFDFYEGRWISECIKAKENVVKINRAIQPLSRFGHISTFSIKCLYVLSHTGPHLYIGRPQRPRWRGGREEVRDHVPRAGRQLWRGGRGGGRQGRHLQEEGGQGGAGGGLRSGSLLSSCLSSLSSWPLQSQSLSAQTTRFWWETIARWETGAGGMTSRWWWLGWHHLHHHHPILDTRISVRPSVLRV